MPSPQDGRGPGGTGGLDADLLLARAASASADDLLRLVRSFAGVDVAFVGEFSLGRRIIRFVRGDGPAASTLVGHSHALGASYCQLIADGSIPAVVDDVSVVPELRTLDVTTELDIASYIGVPIHLSDGSLYGTLCGFGHEACFEWPPGLVELLEAVARMLADHLESPRHRFVDVLAAQDRIRAVLEDPTSMAIVYQPIVALDGGEVVGYEALSRFPGALPEPPEAWFADAHEVGLGPELELLAARRAVTDFPWSTPDTFLAVNLSGSVLCDASIDELLDGVDVQRVVLELTEVEPDQPRLLADGRDRLRRDGIRLAVDDLGAGFAGLSRLIEVEPDIVKLDRFLTMGIGGDARRSAVAAAARHLCCSMGVPLVAEGVETEDDREALLSLGVDLAQGFLFGRPEPLA